MKRALVPAACIFYAVVMMIGIAQAEETVMVVSYAGDVETIFPGQVEPSEHVPGTLLAYGTRIITGEESHIEITFGRSKGNIIKVKADSEVIIMPSYGDGKADIKNGEMTVLLKEIEKGDTFMITSPAAVCWARGTGWNIKTDGEITHVAVFEGRVFVRGIKDDNTVMEGEYLIDEGYQRKIKRLEQPGEMVGLTRLEKEKIKWN
ncbi:MAG: FecR family protein [Candidatus Omnitrophota bacterium]